MNNYQIGAGGYNNYDAGVTSNDLIESYDDDEKKRNRRRSKNDNDGRSHKCDSCGKSYLSYPALYTHVKTKHDLQGKSGKGRGRPKKDIGIVVNSLRLLYNPINFDFFKHPDRTGETLNVKEGIIEAFTDVYGRLRCKSEENQKKIHCYNSLDEHPFYVKILNFSQNPLTLDENSKCDDVFAYYIFKVSKYTRPEFFTTVVKFIILFRDCLNLIYKNKVPVGSPHEYSEVFTAEDAPDISNQFVTEYLATESQSMEFSREEAIDLTQNLCQWLYDNNYTCSKLSLINTS